MSNKPLFKRYPFYQACLIAGLIAVSFLGQASSLKQRQTELKQLHQQINAQKTTLKSTSKQHKKLINLLKKDEQAIASGAKKVNLTKSSLRKTNAKLRELASQKAILELSKKNQQKKLANQLASAYLTGNHDYAKMLLNQQDPAAIERLLVYYQYLNKARMASINDLQQTLEKLKVIATVQTTQKKRLNKLALDQQNQVKALSQEQSQRKKTLKQIRRIITTHEAKLKQLKINEASIKKIVTHALKKMQASAPAMVGLSTKHQVKWPTRGRITSSFGTQRSGQVKWKGVILAAPAGRPITAISTGKVIYADWLRGFGMVMVVDHGKGYMSLYGHAQTLLKNTGDQVQKGETIALIGRSGGQKRSGLYFEIRYKGKAVDPTRYCRR